MARWTAEDIPSLAGRIAVVTGANSGLGFQTALALTRAGAHVVLACRDRGRGLDALERIRARIPTADVSLDDLDLADLASVHRFAKAFSVHHDGLDILVNNAGVMAIPRGETVDGFEMQFGTNHLGHFAVTGLLLDRLLARPGARVVTVSSEVARMGRMHFGDLQGSHRYRRWSAYAQAKLSNQLFTLELDRRATGRGVALVSVGAHPGYAATNLQAVGPRQSGSAIMAAVANLGNATVAQSAAQGALPILFASTAPGVPAVSTSAPAACSACGDIRSGRRSSAGRRDPRTARRLWEVSEKLTGVEFITLNT